MIQLKKREREKSIPSTRKETKVTFSTDGESLSVGLNDVAHYYHRCFQKRLFIIKPYLNYFNHLFWVVYNKVNHLKP